MTEDLYTPADVKRVRDLLIREQDRLCGITGVPTALSDSKKEYQKLYKEKYKDKLRDYAKQYYLKNKEKLSTMNLAYKSANPERILWQSAKERAIRFNLDFTISIDDIIIPSHCKILGLPLYKGKGIPIENSPSLDRINPKLGYTKDNIQIISFKANTMKSNASQEDLVVFAYWIMENYLD